MGHKKGMEGTKVQPMKRRGIKMYDTRSIENVKLSNTVTIKKYLELEAEKDKESIADFIKERFAERYINPVKKRPHKSGFATMALSCLMIEVLESFHRGWKNTKGKSKQAFRSFFEYAYEKELKLGVFHKIADNFYKNIRCGLLHQAETINGWRILRKGKLLNEESKTINANEFLKGVEEFLNFYCEELKQSDWNDDIWKNLRKKMNAIIENCKDGDENER